MYFFCFVSLLNCLLLFDFFTVGSESFPLIFNQCIVNLEGGKLVCKTGKFSHIQELKGGEMVEVWCIPVIFLHNHIYQRESYTSSFLTV